MESKLAQLWRETRHGSWAGRGFRYQDSVAAALAVELWNRGTSDLAITPEGLEDISVRTEDSLSRHVQVKSRLSHRGDFKRTEATTWLATTWKRLLDAGSEPGTTEVELVLERRLEGLSLGEAQILGAHDPLGGALWAELEDQLGRAPPASLLSRTRVRVLADPQGAVLPTLAQGIGLPEAACIAHFLSLRDLLGRVADMNGTLKYEDQQSVGVGDIQRLLDDVTELVDSSALDAAVREGLVEAVDFLTPIDDPAFFDGVDVVPGHVAAGLPVDRPIDVGQLVEGLFSRRSALVKGPSGSGKSALVWLSAYATRHSVRWYRVRSLRDNDVTSLIRMARGARPTDRCPVGFVIDDLGHAWTAGWDRLTREARLTPGVLMLGAVRTEDALLLASEPQCHVHCPKLDQDLAQRIWEDLSKRGETTAAGWRESYSESAGLLLEYSHLLRRGDTLRRTIREQVARRIREKRTVEINILRVVSLADRWDATMPARSVQTRIGASDETFRLGVARLLDEHLVSEVENGVLGGLHRLRSVALCDAIHEAPVPSLGETAIDVLETVDASCLARVAYATIRDHALEPSIAVPVIARRIEASVDLKILIASAVGLRLASLHRQVEAWLQTLERLGVSASHRPLVGLMAAAGVKLPAELNPVLSRAIADLSSVAAEGLRELLIAELEPEKLSKTLEAVESAGQCLDLFASLAAASLNEGTLTLLSRSVERTRATLSILQKAALLEAAYDIAPDLAARICSTFGGTEVLFEALHQELIWTHQLRLEGNRIRGDLRYVVPSEIPDPHEAVVELCRLALACAPDADVAEIKAIFADGRPVGFGGHLVADKRIPRKNLPGSVSVMWRRREFQLFYSAIAQGTQTERLQCEKDLLERCAPLLYRIGSLWCRGKRLSNSVIAECKSVLYDAENLGLPPVVADVLTADIEGSNDIADPLGTLVPGVFSNALRRLYEEDPNWLALAALLSDTLLVELDKISEPGRWRLLEGNPSRAISELRTSLTDLHAAVSELGWGTAKRNRMIRKAAGRKTKGALQFVARVARKDAEKRLEHRLRRVESSLDASGLSVRCLRRAPKKRSGLVWPGDDVLIVHQAPTLFEWVSAVERLVAARVEHLEDVRSVMAAPSRNDLLVVDLGGVLQKQFLPRPDGLDDWIHSPECKPLRVVLARAFSEALESLCEASAIFTGISVATLTDLERSLARRSLRNADRAIKHLVESSIDQSIRKPIEISLELLLAMRTDVEHEIQLVENGGTVEFGVATQLLPDDLEEASGYAQQVGLVKLLLLECDLEGEGVMTRLAEAQARLTRNGATLG